MKLGVVINYNDLKKNKQIIKPFLQRYNITFNTSYNGVVIVVNDIDYNLLVTQRKIILLNSITIYTLCFFYLDDKVRLDNPNQTYIQPIRESVKNIWSDHKSTLKFNKDTLDILRNLTKNPKEVAGTFKLIDNILYLDKTSIIEGEDEGV